jgi:hypothetical protein
MEFKDLKINQVYVHKGLILTKKDSFTETTISGIPFYMNQNDLVEIYDEEKHDKN